MAQIEQRIAYLLERLESTPQGSGNTGRLEEHLTEILRHLEYQRQALAGLGESVAPPAEQFDVSGPFDFVAPTQPMDDYRRMAFDARPDLRAAAQA